MTLPNKMEQISLSFLTLATAILLLCQITCAVGIYNLPILENRDTLLQSREAVALQAVTFSFAKHFQNHMVLQKEPARANIYGFSSNIGQTVSAQLVTPIKTYTYSVKVQQGSNASIGVWNVELDAQDADTTGNFSAISEGTTISLSDLIFGDVWICSGQSNMMVTVNQMNDSVAELADTNYPKIRLIKVTNKESTTPLDDLIEIQQAWAASSPTTIENFSAVCWVYGKNIHKALGYAIGLVLSGLGSTPAEAWSSPEVLAKCNHSQSGAASRGANVFSKYGNQLSAKARIRRRRNPQDNSVLWNAMIHPFLKMTIKGALWYQGESDSGGTMVDHYNCTFPTMINDWRQNFNKFSNGQTDLLFPFGFVQLAPNDNKPNQTVGFPDIRWHQTADYGYVPNPIMPKTFMAVAMDLPDFDGPIRIHPRDKKTVGDRLALSGLAIAYDRQEVFQGPYPEKAEASSNGFVITYGSSSTLEIRNTTGFELLCSNRWAASNITAHDIRSVTLHDVCNAGESIKGVRYAWRESPCSYKMCAVYEKVNGLPAPPFKITTNG